MSSNPPGPPGPPLERQTTAFQRLSSLWTSPSTQAPGAPGGSGFAASGAQGQGAGDAQGPGTTMSGPMGSLVRLMSKPVTTKTEQTTLVREMLGMRGCVAGWSLETRARRSCCRQAGHQDGLPILHC